MRYTGKLAGGALGLLLGFGPLGVRVELVSENHAERRPDRPESQEQTERSAGELTGISHGLSRCSRGADVALMQL